MDVVIDTHTPTVRRNVDYSQRCENCAHGFTGFCMKVGHMTSVCHPETCGSYRVVTQRDVDDLEQRVEMPRKLLPKGTESGNGRVPPIVWIVIAVGILVLVAKLSQ